MKELETLHDNIRSLMIQTHKDLKHCKLDVEIARNYERYNALSEVLEMVEGMINERTDNAV